MNKSISYSNNIKSVEVILKIAERCNINCSYCYYFHGGNKEFEQHPAILSFDNIKKIALFLKEGALSLGLEEVRIDFHGGEPTMMNKNRFDEMCHIFGEILSPHVKLFYAMQTNATLIDDEWIKIFKRHNVGVGVSLDGPKIYNDAYRLDHKGKSTYQQTRNGIDLLQGAYQDKKIYSVGALAVINPAFSAKTMYRHFVDELGFKGMDFLLPDFTHENFNFETVKDYGLFLIELFDEWTQDYKEVDVRIISSLLAKFKGDMSNKLYGFSERAVEDVAFTIQSDGTLAPDDILRSTPLWKTFKPVHVSDTTLTDFLENDFMKRLDKVSRTIPKACEECCWSKVCGGGGIPAHQYDPANETFSNPTVYCDALRDYYSHVANYLITNGMESKKLEAVLFGDEELNAEPVS
jgi:uncharacterized protein